MSNTPIPYEPEFFDGHDFAGTVEVRREPIDAPIPMIHQGMIHQGEELGGFSSRALRVLVKIPGVAMLSDLAGLSEAELLKVKGCGPRVLANIKATMKHYGWELKGDAAPILRRLRLAAALVSSEKYGDARDVLADVYPELATICEKGKRYAGERRDRLPFEKVRPRLIFWVRTDSYDRFLEVQARLWPVIRSWVGERSGSALLIQDADDVEIRVETIGEWNRQIRVRVNRDGCTCEPTDLEHREGCPLLEENRRAAP
jgi:hypothetical protein